MVKRSPRRPSSAPTPRPRRIAGSAGSTPAEATEPTEASQVEEAEPAEETEATRVDPEPVDPEPEAPAERERDEAVTSEEPAGLVGSARTTRVLLVATVVAAVLALAGGVFLWVDDDPGSATDVGSTISVDEETPVRIGAKDAQVAVAAAAAAAHTIVATSYQDYDAQVEESVELMTPAFAEEYRQTAADVEDAIIANKTEVQVEVVAQGVVRADQEHVQGLVFLNMFTTQGGKKPVATPYRVLVTVVNTDQGWLVSDLETK